MASVFKRKDKNGRKSPCWTIQYMDAHGKSRQKKGFTDKQESQRLANKLEHEAKLRRDGLIDSAAEDLAIQMSRCIRQHLSEFLDTVRSRNRTQQYLNHISTRIGAILDEAGIETLAEITLDRVESAIVAIQKRNKMGPRTVNHYMQAMKAFVHWLVPRRLATNPLLELEFHNVAIDVRKERRALTSDEMSLLVDASRTSDQKVQGYSGEQRARIYLISYLTGLRKSEVASLTPESFEITGKTPILTLEARNSKHRKRDVLPLHPQLVALLRLWLPEYPPGEPLFPKLGKRKAHTMIRKDLEAAGIPFNTKDGDADFHASGRHTYITELLRNGTSLVVARELARHADVKMTMRYTHIGLQDQAKGIKNLPTDPKWLEPCPTTDSVSQHISSSSQHICSKSSVSEGQSKSRADSECHSSGKNGGNASSCQTSPSGMQRQKKAPPVTDGASMEDRGLEPLTFWLPARRSPN